MIKIVLNLGALGLAASIAGCSQPVHGDDGGISCVERLRIPIYPPLAASARITGDVAATVLLAPNGSLQSVSLDMLSSSQAPRPVLFPAVEKALRASQFATACGGRTVKVIIKFRIEPKQEDYQPQWVSFEYPNQFQISIPTLAEPGERADRIKRPR